MPSLAPTPLPARHRPDSHDRIGLALAASGVLTFSFSLPMTRLAIREGLDRWFIGVGRAAVAGVLAAVVVVATRTSRPSRADLGRLAVVAAGVVFGFPVLSAYALERVPAIHGSVVNGLLPLVTAGLAVARAGERPSGRYWMWSLLGLGAVLVYALDRGAGSLHAGDVLMLAAVGAAAVGYTEGALLARRLGGWQVICWALVISLPVTVPITVLSAGQNADPSATGWLGFAYLSVFSMLLGFFGWYAGMARAGIARAGQLQLLQPVLSIVWAWPILGERLDALAVGCAIVVLVAVAAGRNAPIRHRHHTSG